MSTKAKRERMAQERDTEKCHIDDFIHQYKFEHEHITDYQIRINETIDVFPTSKKYFLLKKKRWGQYNRVDDLLPHLSTPKT